MDRRRSHISDIEYAAKITEEAMPPEPLLRVGYVLSNVIPKVKFFQQADLAELGFRDPVKRKMVLPFIPCLDHVLILMFVLTLKLYEGAYHSILEGEPDDRIFAIFHDIISWLDSRCSTTWELL
ncbi:hypothetical protein Droror1_Dr00014270 [Drosera rotundifolia]